MSNLADNLQLFGLEKGSTNLFALTYTGFGTVVKSQYPNILSDFYPAAEVLDTSYLEELQKAATPQGKR